MGAITLFFSPPYRLSDPFLEGVLFFCFFFSFFFHGTLHELRQVADLTEEVL